MKKFFPFLFALTCAILCTSVANAQSSGIIITIAGNGTFGYSGDNGAATAAELNGPWGVHADASGNIYIADWLNNVVRKVSTSGIISTIAGNNSLSHGYSGNGGPATAAQLNGPRGVVVDASGNIYIADAGNYVVRKVNASGIISTFAGNDTLGYTGDGGAATAARLSGVNNVAIDGAGNIYISDGYKLVRKVNNSGIISTLAGNNLLSVGYSGDGGAATVAQLNGVQGMAIDALGNIYIADGGNDVIRKVNALGIISTIAGNNSLSHGYSGDGGPATAARLYGPADVAVDALGNIFIVDEANQVIRKVNTLGIISSVAGNDTLTCCDIRDGGPATAGQLLNPEGIAIDGGGNIYIADYGHDRIRKVYYPTYTPTLSNTHDYEVYPNPATTILIITATTPITSVAISNLLGQPLFTHEYNTTHVQIDVADLPGGMYLMKVNDTEVRRFVKPACR